MKNEHLVSFTLDELKSTPSKTDWAKVKATTEDDILRHMAEDGDLDDTEVDLADAELVVGLGQKNVRLHLDREVVSFFKSQGPGYQSRINQVLRHYMESVEKKAG
jgi:uncharacterized protein (DUF4415 family)